MKLRRVGFWVAAAPVFWGAVVFCPPLRAQATFGLQITAPADRTVVHPGDVVTVTVSPLTGVSPSFVAVVAKFPLQASAQSTQPCFQFTITVPSRVPTAGL